MSASKRFLFCSFEILPIGKKSKTPKWSLFFVLLSPFLSKKAKNFTSNRPNFEGTKKVPFTRRHTGVSTRPIYWANLLSKMSHYFSKSVWEGSYASTRVKATFFKLLHSNFALVCLPWRAIKNKPRTVQQIELACQHWDQPGSSRMDSKPPCPRPKSCTPSPTFWPKSFKLASKGSCKLVLSYSA